MQPFLLKFALMLVIVKQPTWKLRFTQFTKMNTNVFFCTLLSLSTLFFAPATQAADLGHTPVASTPDVRDFTGIISNLPADVFVVQGTEFKLEINGPADAVAALQSEVKNGMLHLSLNQPLRSAEELVIMVTMPAVAHLAANNTGDIVMQSTLKTNELHLSVAGTGNIALTHVEANTIEAQISGAGNIRAGQSTANRATLAISGTGDIDMPLLAAQDCEASITGRGDIRVRADKSLNANIAGSGNVQYTGSAAVQHTVTGRGEIRTTI